MHFGQILTQVTLGDQRAEHIEENKNKLATVMAATGRITVTAQIDPSYSPGGVNEHLLIHSPPRVDQRESSPNGISIVSAVSAGFTDVSNRHSDTHTDHATSFIATGRILFQCMRCGPKAKRLVIVLFYWVEGRRPTVPVDQNKYA